MTVTAEIKQAALSLLSFVKAAQDRRQLKMEQRWKFGGRYVTVRTASQKAEIIAYAKANPGKAMEADALHLNEVPVWRRVWEKRKYHNATAYSRPASKLKPRFEFKL